jgi:hypothetical protein
LIYASRDLFRKDDRDGSQDGNWWVVSGPRAVKDGSALIGPAVTVKEVSGTLGTYTIDDFKIGMVIDMASGL